MKRAFPRPVRRLAASLTVVTAVLMAPDAAWAQDTFQNVQKIVAVGDVHGGFDEFVAVLRDAGIIDATNKWTGGRAHLVQTGDVLDRGPDSRKAMDLLMALERQAGRAGGRVHALLGNHEVMNVLGDLRYVSAREYAAFVKRDSEALRNRAFELLADPGRKDEDGYRAQWNAAHPLGWVEHRQAFSSDGEYGKWLRRHQAAVRINDLLFLHGGIGPAYADLSVAEINSRIRTELAEPESIPSGLSGDDAGPLWYRGLAQGAESDLAAHVDRLLQKHGVRHIVVGHTIVAPAVVPRFNGKVITIDVGLSSFYGGPPACLLVENGKLFALHRRSRVEIPTTTGGVRGYLEHIAALDPQPSRLLEVIDQVAAPALEPAVP